MRGLKCMMLGYLYSIWGRPGNGSLNTGAIRKTCCPDVCVGMYWGKLLRLTTSLMPKEFKGLEG